jgi:Alternative oxidase
MVGAMIRHLHSLRLMKRDHGWIHTLLEEVCIKPRCATNSNRWSGEHALSFTPEQLPSTSGAQDASIKTWMPAKQMLRQAGRMCTVSNVFNTCINIALTRRRVEHPNSSASHAYPIGRGTIGVEPDAVYRLKTSACTC